MSHVQDLSIIEAVVGICVGVRYRLRCRQRNFGMGLVLCVVHDDVLLTLLEDTFNTDALFLQGDSYLDDSERVQFRFLVGISLGISVLKEIND